jgi:hypothetical protein
VAEGESLPSGEFEHPIIASQSFNVVGRLKGAARTLGRYSWGGCHAGVFEDRPIASFSLTARPRWGDDPERLDAFCFPLVEQPKTNTQEMLHIAAQGVFLYLNGYNPEESHAIEESMRRAYTARDEEEAGANRAFHELLERLCEPEL